MKRKVLEKMFASGLVCTMVLGLASCGNAAEGNADGNTDGGTSSAEVSGEAAASSGQAAVSEGTGERQMISISTLDYNAGSNNVGEYAEEIRQKMQEYTGVDFEITWVSSDALEEKNALYMANPATMPNIITWSGTLGGQVAAAARSGAFVDLNDYIWDSEKYPNLSGMAKSVSGNLMVDGRLIGIPRTRVIGRYGLSYRTDWFEKLKDEYHLVEPSTPEAVYNMLYAFTYGDPDGNGIDDTIGMEMTSLTDPFDIIQTWFGCGNGWADVDGQLLPVFMQEEYKEAVDYIKKLYDDGLMPLDWVSRPQDDRGQGCRRGDNGAIIDTLDDGKRIWYYFVADETFTPSVVNPEEAASMTLYGAVNGHTLATAGYNGFFTLSATTLNTPEKIEAALTLLDKLNDPEMLLLTQYGLEDINYRMEDGYLVDLDVNDGNLYNNYAGLNQLLAFLPSSEAATAAIPLNLNERDKAQNDAYAAALPHAVTNPALPYLVGSETYASEGATLDANISAARSQYICGEIDMEGLEKAISEWRRLGGDKIIEEVNAQYQAEQ